MTLDTIYPVGFLIPPASSYFTSKENQEKGDQGPLKSAHVTAVAKTDAYPVATLEKSFEAFQNKLQTALISLGKQNQQLNLALITQTSHRKKVALLHDEQTHILEKRVQFLQQQMSQLAKAHEENTKRLERLLSVAQQEQTAAIDLAKQVWGQERTGLLRQHKELETQKSSLASQRTSLSKEQGDLRSQINEESKRQQAAIQERATKAKEYFSNRVLDIEIEITSDPRRMSGRPSDGKGALVFLRNHLYNLFY